MVIHKSLRSHADVGSNGLHHMIARDSKGLSGAERQSRESSGHMMRGRTPHPTPWRTVNLWHIGNTRAVAGFVSPARPRRMAVPPVEQTEAKNATKWRYLEPSEIGRN